MAASKEPGRLLVVDDEEMVRLVIRAVVVQRGYRVVEAGDGEEALERYAADPAGFDLVLADQNMPRLGGCETILQLRQRTPHLPAILLSGGVQERESERLMGQWGVEFLPKPFENAELIEAVERMTALGRAVRMPAG